MTPNRLTEPPDPALCRCYDCRHMQAAVAWWCTNNDAILAHRTQVPRRTGCQFWEPGEWPPPRTPPVVPAWVVVALSVVSIIAGTVVLGMMAAR